MQPLFLEHQRKIRLRVSVGGLDPGRAGQAVNGFAKIALAMMDGSQAAEGPGMQRIHPDSGFCQALGLIDAVAPMAEASQLLEGINVFGLLLQSGSKARLCILHPIGVQMLNPLQNQS